MKELNFFYKFLDLMLMKVETNVVEIGEVKDNKMCAIEKVTL